MVTVGVLVRVARHSVHAVARRLDAIEGVSTLALEDPTSVGVVLQAADLDAGHRLLRERVERTEGVLAAWPIHTELGASAPPGDSPSADPLTPHAERPTTT